jgi:hypothetical protein
VGVALPSEALEFALRLAPAAGNQEHWSVEDDLARWAPLVKAIGLKLD